MVAVVMPIGLVAMVGGGSGGGHRSGGYDKW